MIVLAAVLPLSTLFAGSRAAFGRVARIAMQSAGLAGIWLLADFAARTLHLPVPGGVVGLLVLLALLFCGGIAPPWVQAGAGLPLSDLPPFFLPPAVSPVLS